MRQPFFVIEALDAGGSQTQTDLLKQALIRNGYTPHQYHFPQEDKATGILVYNKFLHHKNKEPFSRREQALLYIQDFFSQADAMWDVIEKGKKKEIVLSDRYCTSTMAYQTIGLSGKQRQHMMDWIIWLCWQGAPVLPKPDIVIFLDTPVEVSMGHLSQKKKDYFETRDKLKIIRNSYLRAAEEQQWIIINSMNETGKQRSKKDIHNEVWQHVKGMLP